LALEELPHAAVGQEVTAYVIDEDERDLRLSLTLTGDAALEHLEEARRTRLPVQGRVQSRNSGGYEVLVGSVRAFCPQSLIARQVGTDPDAYLGQTLSFRVLETGEKVVLDRRSLEREELAATSEPVWRSLQVGQTHRATIRSVHSFGAFAEFLGVEGLIPRSEISWERGEPTELLAPGQEVEVVVLSVDAEAKKASFSCRRPEDDPFSLAAKAYPPGAVLTGRVTRVERYGAFIELRPGVQALLHSSHLPSPPEVGATLEVQIGAVDLEKRRIDVHQVGATATAPSASPLDAGPIDGTVEQVNRQGVSIKLPDGRTGWLPANEAELPAGTLLEQRFRLGRRVTVRVARDDPRRPTLTQRQSTEDGEAAWRSQLQRGGAATSGSDRSLGTLADLLQAAAKKQKK
jgi:small subunit ribosomal protein S1